MAALLFRALVPAGFMPVQGETGSIVMQLCSGSGTKSAIVDMHPDSDTNQTGNQLFEHSPCGFAAPAFPAPPPAAAAIGIANVPEIHAVVQGPASSVVPSIARSQSPRAPPLI